MGDDRVELTPRAKQLIRKTFSDREKHPIRLFVKLGGCGIRSFGVALEKPTEHDEIFLVDGFQYVVNRKLLEKVTPIKVDSDGFGFRISGSGVAPHHGCGNCGFICGDGNRCSGDCTTCSHVCGYGRRVLKEMEADNAGPS
jgi:Fe-S cluster assembly iron-binding protein IscA